MTRKRSSETKAEKLPSKKTRDGEDEDSAESIASPQRAPSVEATTTRSTPIAPIRQIESENGSIMLTASDPVDSISVIPKPPTELNATIEDTAVNARQSAKPDTQTAVSPQPSRSSPPAKASATPAIVTQTKQIVPWYYSTVFFFAIMFLLSNMVTLGLWMQYELEVNLDSREIALVAKEEATAAFQSKIDALERSLSEASSSAQEARNEADQAQELVNDLRTKLDSTIIDKKHWHRESIRVIGEREGLAKQLRDMELDRNEWQKRAGKDGKSLEEKFALKKALGDLQSELGVEKANSLTLQNERDSAQTQTESLLEEMQQMNVVVEKLEAEGNELRDEVTKLIKQKRKLREECGIQ